MAFILIGVLLAAGAATLHFLRPLLTVTQPVQGPVVQAFYATGTLLPDREFPIKSNVEGIVTEVLVDKGDSVHKDQKLAFVSVDDLQFKYRQALADLEMKKQLADEKNSPTLNAFDAQIKAFDELIRIAQREATRLEELVKRNAASTVDLDRANDRVQQLLSQQEAIRGQRGSQKLELEKDEKVAQAALEIAQWNLDQQTIKSPIDGVVLDRPVSRGTRVKVNDLLMQVANVEPKNLVMRSAVDEEDKAQVRMNQVVRMTLYSFPGEVFSGRVIRIYPKADPERRTFEVDVAMAKPDARFAAGMTGELAFVLSEKAVATVIPSQAVQAGNVWVVRGNELAKADVRLGLRSVERTEVISGLEPGDRVVISPVDGFKVGQIVRTEAVDPVVAAGLNKKAQEQAFRGFN